MNKPKKVLLVGNGRLARHLAYWNSFLKVPNLICNLDKFENLENEIQSFDVIWLAVSDSAIDTVYREKIKPALLEVNDVLIPFPRVVHFSGALNISELCSAHPLMSFGNELYLPEVYDNIYFAVTGAEKLSDLMPGFENSFVCLKPEHKPLYHALCVLTGNFPQMLWMQTQLEFKNLGFPEQAANTYINKITENFLLNGRSALTGPHVRGDQETIAKNLSALSQLPELQNIYSAFTNQFNKGSFK